MAIGTLATSLYYLPPSFDSHRRADAAAVAKLASDFPLPAVGGAIEVLGVVSALIWVAVGALILWRRSGDLLGIMVGLGFIAIGLGNVPPPREAAGAARAVYGFTFAFTVPWIYVFPDGRWIPRWSVIPAAIWAVWRIAIIVVPDLAPGAIDAVIPGLRGLAIVLYQGLILSAIGSLVFRFARRSDAVQRQQIKWLAFSGALLAIPAETLTALLVKGPPPDPVTRIAIFLGQSALLDVLGAAVPVAAAIAIFRLGLFDIDLFIKRTAAYGGLTAALVGIFIALSALAQRIAGPLLGDRADLLTGALGAAAILAFLPARARARALADRFLSGPRLLTILFVDIVGSTGHAVRLGDRAWSELLERFRATVRRELKRYDGEEIDTAGDSFFVTFTEANRAIRCAKAITESVRTLGLEVRAGIHIGEVEVSGAHVSGVAVHASARLMALAGPGEITLSSSLRDLLAGSSIETRDRGEHELRGVPGKWRVYSLRTA